VGFEDTTILYCLIAVADSSRHCGLDARSLGTRSVAAEAAKKVPMFRELLLSYSRVRICQEEIRDCVRSDERMATYASMDDLLDAVRESTFRFPSAGQAMLFRRL